jgi:hypothetical protein
MTGYSISEIIDWGIDLGQFDPIDWTYDPYRDVILVRDNSKLHTWLCLFDKSVA